MTQSQTLRAVGMAIAVIVSGTVLHAQGDPATLAKEKVAAQYKLTKTAADRSDIVTAGDVVVLHKDGLMMCSTAGGYAYSNTYANGVMQANLKNRTKNAFKAFGMGALTGGASVADAANNGCPSRKFVAGEKFWVTGIELKKDSIQVDTYSDPYNDTHYYGEIQFPFVKGSVPSPDAMVKTVAEVITVQPADDDKSDKADDKKDAAPAPAQEAPAAPAATLAPIAPPPPPPDQPPAPPKTIAVGQTKAVVVAAWGQPTKVVKLSSKEIYYYPDMKVTFVAGKVSDVQ
jgi:hypothetical protein